MVYETTPDVPPATARRVLLCILVGGAAVRLALWLLAWHQPLSIEDEQHYDLLAANLVKYGEFADGPGRLTSIRPPLYPAVVASVYSLFGVGALPAARFLQVVLGLLTVVLAYRLGLAVASRRVALWLAGFCCFYPSLVGYTTLLLTEVLFTFLFGAFCLLVVLAMQRQSLAMLAAAGVVLGLAALTRSVVWLFPPVLAIFLLFAWKGNMLLRLAAGGVVIVTFAATLAPWSIRNSRLQETFVAVDVMGGRNFMMGNYRHTPLYRSWAAISLQGEESWLHEVTTTYPPSERRTQGQIDKLALRQGLKFVRENPGLTLLRSLVKFFDFWGLERELLAGAAQGIFGPFSKPALALLALVLFGSYAFALFLGLFGLVMAPVQDRRAGWLLLLTVAYICGMHSLVFGHSRYHLPLMPIILLYAAGAVVNARRIWSLRRSKPFLLACSVCAVFVLAWLWLFVAVDLDLYLKAMHSVD